MNKRLLVLLVLEIVAILTFSAGFFPQKSVLQGDAQFNYKPEAHRRMAPKFEKMVLVIVDALRSDFVFQKDMSEFGFLHKLLNKGHAWGYTAYSNPPTVTLPRLKGITTGSTPNFLDAILNVAEDDVSSNLKEQDSWLRQFRMHQKKIKFFGDDTWLKLFPSEFFDETDGTNSFFVSDFEEVDLNVTRHLPQQLQSQDSWDVLILHYLGLDHIGHKGGAFSSFMPPKHREMDAVIEQIYNAVGEDTLICVMGDHGMNDLGNHGGSSAGETSAALVFISKLLEKYEKPLAQQGQDIPVASSSPEYNYLTKVNQIDFVPTIATLFNLPVPKNSIGVLIPDFLKLLSPADAKTKVIDNYQQLLSISGGSTKKLGDPDAIIEEMREVQSDLAKTATNYNYLLLGIGFLTLLVVSSVALFFSWTSFPSTFGLFLLLGTSLLLSLSTFGSSFIEEEHQIWWWTSIALVGLSYISAPRELGDHLTVLAVLRLIRGWNNSGQKFVYEYTLYELLKQHYQVEWLLITTTIFVVQFQGRAKGFSAFQYSFLMSVLCLVYKATWSIVNNEQVPAWLQHICLRSYSIMKGVSKDQIDFSDALVPMARLFFQVTAAVIAVEVIRHQFKPNGPRLLEEIHAHISTLLILQTSSANIPQFLAFHILSRKLNSLWSRRQWSFPVLMTVNLVLQHLSFFQFGNTNSIATVSLTNAYNGVSENYNIYVVGALMCVSNFAPSIYWSLSCLKILYSKSTQSKWETFFTSRLPSFLYYCLFGCFLLGSCVILRYHLFIWSVFSPKLCYYVSWNLFMNAIIAWFFEGTLVALL
ncbi:mannose-ethanolamine phosphotransferase LAS21 [Lachancea thermotolerans CBS 6340]|uniref:GPI ethanolamine phosphate transferase 2 n=1 Tax=Lachancea thermotolerans (strain ATCC 56472 / CBS 6340 / NRRL Y-8284) TaxID=559295 RepID=C5E365_LACTC|nr:KLTH0H10736p [Lachancea thermotolerans CBS 6340]CAR30476.1 KLTH0H10736p [Lachancea thermotolerans CBS 6340]